MSTYTNNTLTNYRVKLHHSLDLTGQWEVGLTEIQYPHSWYNVSEDQAWFEIVENPEAPVVRFILKNGYYNSPDKIMKTIWGLKRSINGGEKVKIEFDDVSHKVTITIQEEAVMKVSTSLAKILGFEEEEFRIGIHIAPWVCDVRQGFHSLYIYSNIVQSSMVGDALVPLLRIVAIEGSSGEMVTHTYQNIQYVPLQQRQFDTIEIDIKDDTGLPVPFERGKVIVTLHFRQRKES